MLAGCSESRREAAPEATFYGFGCRFSLVPCQAPAARLSVCRAWRWRCSWSWSWSLNVEDLYPQDKRGKITARGGATEWIHWQSGTAQLLPRLIACRTRGPLFLTDRKAPAGTLTLDVCPETGRARLSHRRAEEIFKENTRLLANPLASPDDTEDLDGWTLHRLQHSALTHDAEDGTSTPMLLARSRHASVRSLERYARPGVDSVARHLAEHNPLHAAARKSEQIRTSRSSRCPFDPYPGQTPTAVEGRPGMVARPAQTSWSKYGNPVPSISIRRAGGSGLWSCGNAGAGVMGHTTASKRAKSCRASRGGGAHGGCSSP